MSARGRREQNSAGESRPLVLPPSVRYAGWLGIIEGAVGLAVAVVMIVRELNGFHDEGAKISGYGTALWFIIFGGVVAVAGWFLKDGRRWGRGPVAMVSMILVLVSYYMFTSGRPELGVPTVLVGLVGLALLFNPSAVEWAARRYGD
ncbi:MULTISPECIES: hypothetical protein [Corynebacterium]|jgi:uncharacterized membrane protein (UPF0136 family)|uniref:Integral membrane protein n=1 Tax=Corynebacterium provencense TaxID=1737425 RepID=A0A2Z3YMU4_9CORY|nr:MULTISPECIES: hypothetical protein [Corynebacterium]AWT25612.1 hypothetical protein Csp1_08030 [Corynebacterium provencense]MCI1256359.1 hypothetical protein [Corynebacterium provencense]